MSNASDELVYAFIRQIKLEGALPSIVVVSCGACGQCIWKGCVKDRGDSAWYSRLSKQMKIHAHHDCAKKPDRTEYHRVFVTRKAFEGAEDKSLIKGEFTSHLVELW